MVKLYLIEQIQSIHIIIAFTFTGCSFVYVKNYLVISHENGSMPEKITISSLFLLSIMGHLIIY